MSVQFSSHQKRRLEMLSVILGGTAAAAICERLLELLNDLSDWNVNRKKVQLCIMRMTGVRMSGD